MFFPILQIWLMGENEYMNLCYDSRKLDCHHWGKTSNVSLRVLCVFWYADYRHALIERPHCPNVYQNGISSFIAGAIVFCCTGAAAEKRSGCRLVFVCLWLSSVFGMLIGLKVFVLLRLRSTLLRIRAFSFFLSTANFSAWLINSFSDISLENVKNVPSLGLSFNG